MEVREVDVERQGAPHAGGQRSQDLDLAGVPAGHLEHHAARLGSDAQEMDGAVGQLLGALEDGPPPLVPAIRWRRPMAQAEHGGAQVEAAAGLKDDLGALEGHGPRPSCTGAGVARQLR